MEGVSAENNEIYLELTSENLSRALKTAQNARALKIKLTNKHFPCLTVSVELVSRRVRVPEISHRSLGFEGIDIVSLASLAINIVESYLVYLNLKIWSIIIFCIRVSSSSF